MCANIQVHCGPMVLFTCSHTTLLHYHHYEDVSEDTEPLKCLSGTFCLACVSKIKSILSIIFYLIYWAVSIQLAHFSYDDCENTCTLSYYHHHQIGSMTHLPLFRVRSWNNGLSCTYFYILIKQFATNSPHLSVPYGICSWSPRRLGMLFTMYVNICWQPQPGSLLIKTTEEEHWKDTIQKWAHCRSSCYCLTRPYLSFQLPQIVSSRLSKCTTHSFI